MNNLQKVKGVSISTTRYVGFKLLADVTVAIGSSEVNNNCYFASVGAVDNLDGDREHSVIVVDFDGLHVAILEGEAICLEKKEINGRWFEREDYTTSVRDVKNESV